MAKRRIHEIAKELGIPSKELVVKVRELGYDIKNYMSTLEDVDAQIVIDKLGKSKQEEAPKKKPRVIRRRRKEVDESPAASAEAHKVVRRRKPEAEAAAGAGHESQETMEPAATGPEAGVSEQAEQTQDELVDGVRETGKESGSEAGPSVVEQSREGDVSEDAAESLEATEAAPAGGDTVDVREEETPTEAEAGTISEAEPPAKQSEAEAAETGDSEQVENARPAELESAAGERKEEIKKKPKTENKGGAVVIGMRKGFRQVFPSQERGYRSGGYQRRGPQQGQLGQRHGPGFAAKPFGGSGGGVPAGVFVHDIPVPGKTQRRKTKKDVDDHILDDLPKRKSGGRRRQVLSRDDIYDITEPLQRGKRKKITTRKAKKTEITTPKEIKRRVKVDGTITVSELAKAMGVKAAEVIKQLMAMGEMVTLNQPVDADTAAVVAAEFDFQVENVAFNEETVLSKVAPEAVGENDQPRPPVVTVMGHVDHGKTSVLDAIRSSHVVDQESGGITQHIGAYVVRHEKGNIVFIDTPGHAAFTAMRARGAKVTDIVVLVVAADDGVMEQTVEAINHAKAAGVPIIVAVNKMDLPGANLDRVKQSLSEYDLVPEEWGGETLVVPVSAKTGQGLEDLLESILLQAELLELKADPTVPARGVVIEAKLDKGRGPAVTILVQEGTLKKGDYLVAGCHYGKVRALLDDEGRQLDSAGPSFPVEVLGLSGVPEAGDDANVVASDKDARKLVEFRQQRKREEELAKSQPVRRIVFGDEAEGPKELNLLLKADVQGSVEALREALLKLSTDEVAIKIIHEGVGAVTENDINLAQASNGVVIGFRVRPDNKASKLAEEGKTEIILFNVIYEAIDAVKKLMAGQLEPEFEEHFLGRAEVRQVFNISKVGAIAGSYVTEGKIVRGASARLLRDNVVVHEGRIGSLRRFKDDAREVSSGYECGIGLENFNDIKVNDVIEAFEVREVTREI